MSGASKSRADGEGDRTVSQTLKAKLVPTGASIEASSSASL
ncbi:MAG: hypothetical protein WBA57_26925 [Elainellaceae cyanobacterium]